MRIRIRNGRLLDPAAKLDRKGDLCIAERRIVAAGRMPAGFRADREIDAAGLWVLPGLVDLCAYLREPGFEHKGTIASECAAAVAGGVTSLCCPPDTSPAVDTPAVVELIHHRAAATGKARVHVLGALTQGLGGERLAEMQALKGAGCLGVSNARRPFPNSEVLRRAMEYAASCGLPVFLHAEDHFLRNAGVMHEGAISTRLGLPPIPESAETVAISRALLLMEHTGARVHFCRVSTAHGLELVNAARTRGLPVSMDAGICHLHLTDEDVDGYAADCHLDPPLRTAADRDALRRALARGALDAVCSDHQPHDPDAKSAPFSLTEPGASTIEHLLPLLLAACGSSRTAITRAIASVTIGPARILGIEAGTLARGAPADVTLFDPAPRVTVDRAALRSAGHNSPFHGRRLRGRVRCTLVDGKVVFQA